MGVGKRLSRLCRLMCGRSLTFRLSLFGTLRGYAPKVGEAQKPIGLSSRWGKAATAHQTAQPQTNPNALARFDAIKRADLSLLRSFRVHLAAGFYKYFVPTGLVPLAIAIAMCTLAVINSRAH